MDGLLRTEGRGRRVVPNVETAAATGAAGVLPGASAGGGETTGGGTRFSGGLRTVAVDSPPLLRVSMEGKRLSNKRSPSPSGTDVGGSGDFCDMVEACCRFELSRVVAPDGMRLTPGGW